MTPPATASADRPARTSSNRMCPWASCIPRSRHSIAAYHTLSVISLAFAATCRGGLGLVRAGPLRQCMNMIQQENGFVWPLVSETAGVQLHWHKLGSATWLDGVASFPRGPDE